jgi:hypothetical protein
LSCTLITILSARSQGSFQNLGFESAHSLPPPGSYVAVVDALPGWTAATGSVQVTAIPYNMVVAFPRVGLYGSNTLEISGVFSVLLSRDGSISQTGLVAENAESLLFKGHWTSATPLGVFLGGQSLSYVAISNGPNYTLYGADISTFAGQTARMDFFAQSPSLYLLDDIEFSSQPIPEPASLALLCWGGLLLAARWFRRPSTGR